MAPTRLLGLREPFWGSAVGRFYWTPLGGASPQTAASPELAPLTCTLGYAVNAGHMFFVRPRVHH